MDNAKLKIELLQKMIACNDAEVLKKVEEILDSSISEVAETGEGYLSEKNIRSEPFFKSESISNNRFSISSEQEEELMRRVADHSSGKGKTFSWDEIKKDIRNIERS